MAWRLGGKRDGAPQSITFPTPPGAAADDTLAVALAAKQLVESRRHAITNAEVSRAIYGARRAVPLDVPTVAGWADQWLTDRRRFRDVQPDTLTTYERILRLRVLPRLGHLYLTEIGPDTIRDWVAWLETQKTVERPSVPSRPLSAQAVRSAHGILHQLLGAAVPRWLPTNPAARPAGARKHTAGLPKVVPFEGMFLEPQEVDAILRNAEPPIRDLIYAAVRTGLRLGELLVLRVQDVTFTGKRPAIKVVRALKRDGTIGPPKSDRSKRDVTISKEVVAVLAARAAGRKRGDLLFTAPMGGRWAPSHLRRRYWVRAIAAAQRCPEHPPPLPPWPARGVRRKWRPDEVSTCACPGRLHRTPRFHDLRHTHVSLLVEDGWTPKRVQLRVGHSTFAITMDIYGHLWERGDEGRLDSIERLLAMREDESA